MFDARYPELFADICRVCRALGAGGDADDIAQETLIVGRSQLPSLRDEASLLPWLRRIAVRATFRSRRSGRRFWGHRAPDLAAGADATDPCAEFDFDNVEIAVDESQALRALSPRQRQYVALVYFAGYTQEEVAEMLDVARGTVAKTIWEARASLAHSLADYEGGPK